MIRLGNFLSDLRGTTKPSVRQEILLHYEQGWEVLPFRQILHWAYDPFTLFNVNINKKDLPAPGDKDLIELFDNSDDGYDLWHVIEFCKESKSPKQNKERVMPLLTKLNAGSQELVIGILSKNLKAGINEKTILSVFPGLFKRFCVQLANSYKPTVAGCILPTYLYSYKLDGLRCIALRVDDEWKLYSRKGKEFLTVDYFKPQLEHYYSSYGWTFFDGEIYKHGLKFEEIQGPVMAFTRGQAEGLDYNVFLAGAAQKFLNCEDPNHVKLLNMGDEDKEAPQINFVGLGELANEDIYEKLDEAFELGYEGLMLRDPKKLYDYKRSNAILKLKESKEGAGEEISDCVVTGVELKDDFPVVYENEQGDNIVITECLINKLTVKQADDTICTVGSGFDLDFRRKDPEDLIDKIVEIKHQGYGNNGRMRFPRLYRVREDL